ncbi:MAG: DUF805 domain-containing protein [Paludibacteraceae bacterium]|nr:DUF805 domain-containing protein [Paludibacteraceae bacterium]
MEVIDLFINPWFEFSDIRSKSSRKAFWVFAFGNLFVFFLFFLFTLSSYDNLLTDDFRDFVASILSLFSYDVNQMPVMSILQDCQQYSFIYKGIAAFLLALVVWIAFILCPIAFYALYLFFLLSIDIYILRLFTIYTLLVMLPYFSLTIRRLRDAGYGPLTYLVQLIPFIGNLIFLFLLIMKNPNNKG